MVSSTVSALFKKIIIFFVGLKETTKTNIKKVYAKRLLKQNKLFENNQSNFQKKCLVLFEKNTPSFRMRTKFAIKKKQKACSNTVYTKNAKQISFITATSFNAKLKSNCVVISISEKNKWFST